MSLYARQLNINDLERSLAVETAAFPPAEAATREKVVISMTGLRYISNLYLRLSIA
jgi:hypothetical protein